MDVNEQLVDLYHVDRRCAFLRRRLAEIPGALENLREEGLSRSGVGSKRHEELEDLEKSIRGVERELAAQRDLAPAKLEKRKKATSLAEMQAADREIETLEQVISHLEDRLLGKMESLGILERESQIREPREQARVLELAREANELDAELGECRTDLEKSELERERLIAALDPAVARRYVRIFGSRGHGTLASLRDGACGGCGETLPAQLLIEVSEMNSLEQCQGCGRILIRTDR